MDLFTGDRQLPTNAVDLCPFPTTISQHTNGVQKLRPVRFNGRDLTDAFPDPVEPSSLLNCSLPGHFDYMNMPTWAAGDGVARNGLAAMDQMKAGFDAQCGNIISQARALEAALSLSSGDSPSSSDASKEPENRKRKRKSRENIELFLENMMNQVMQKQEQMHNQLVEMIEKKEKERIIREEAWRQQEIERAKRDQELRAQDTSRSLALISFIQNLMGHQVQIPKLSETLCAVNHDEDEIHNQEEFKCDPSNPRWPKPEVQALITVRAALEYKFIQGTKGYLWDEVAAELAKMGYNRTPKKCKEKWENINKYYRRTTENGTKRRSSHKACPYFHELDIIYRSGLITAGSANLVKTEMEDSITKE